MSEHTYPSRYPPGVHWSLDEAWGILDRLKPGVLEEADRAFLAGLIAGTLQRLDKERHRRDARRAKRRKRLERAGRAGEETADGGDQS